MKTSFYISITALVALLVCACAGLKARENALLPAMQVAWPPIAQQVERGIQEDPSNAEHLRLEAQEMADALQATSVDLLRDVDWPALQQSAVIGINARVSSQEITSGVAGSLLERVSQFNNAYVKAIIQ